MALSPAGDGSRNRAIELSGAGLTILMADAVAIPVNVSLGLVGGETASVQMLAFAVIGGGALYSVCSLVWRLSNLLTVNLGVSALNYATPALSLLWLFVFTSVATLWVGYLVAGAVVMVLANYKGRCNPAAVRNVFRHGRSRLQA